MGNVLYLTYSFSPMYNIFSFVKNYVTSTSKNILKSKENAKT
jgi:hypothetical protein